VVAEMLSVEVKTKGEDGNVTRDTHHVNLEQAYRTRTFAREILYFMSEEVRSGIREDFMKSKCRPKLVETNDPVQRASASKAKSSVLSQLSGLENVVFNDFIDDELDSEDVSEQRASASLPDSVPIESEEERAAREADEMAALDSVGDYEADPNVILEDVPQDIVIKTLKVSCACVPVLVFACVCVCACTRRRYVFVRICICIF
jgi:hypothetical protein